MLGVVSDLYHELPEMYVDLIKKNQIKPSSQGIGMCSMICLLIIFDGTIVR